MTIETAANKVSRQKFKKPGEEMIRIILGVIIGFIVWSIVWVGGEATLAAVSPD